MLYEEINSEYLIASILRLFGQFEQDVIDSNPNCIDEDFSFQQFILWMRHTAPNIIAEPEKDSRIADKEK